jgi:tRNA (uracil-5-)-methyltransferase TRM9
MLASTKSLLLDLNRQFYQTFASSFAETRRRIQPGVRQVLAGQPQTGRWLDLGCGSGALAQEWALSSRAGLYLGLDFSPGLLEEAERAASSVPHPGLEILFQPVDLSAPGWALALAGQQFDTILAFAVLHHLPGKDLRRDVLTQVNALLPPGGAFIHSEWQFQNSPRLLARRLPWESLGLSPEAVEEGDSLLDWRHPQPGQPGEVGRRYVHQFSLAELEELAAQTGFRIQTTFESDGEGGRLGLYQVWKKA